MSKRSRACFAVCGLLSLVGAHVQVAWAAPTAEAYEPIKERFERKIAVEFLDSPLPRVIEHLQKQSNVTFILEHKTLGDAAKTPVRFESTNMSVREVLGWVCRIADVDWDVENGVVVVTTSQAVARRHMVTKNYDIRGLLVRYPDFRGASLGVDQALGNTSSGGSGARMGAEGRPMGGGAGLFADTSGIGEEETQEASRDELVEQIIQVITEEVGVPSEWVQNGGELSGVRELNGVLRVKTTAANHAAVGKQLEQLHAQRSKMVAVEAKVFLVKSKALDELLADNRGIPVFDSLAADQLLSKIQRPEQGGRLVSTQRLVCQNGQRSHVSAINEHAFLSDVSPVAGAGGGDPTLSTLVSGAVLDVRPTINVDGQSVTATVRSDVSTGRSLRTSSLPQLPSPIKAADPAPAPVAPVEPAKESKSDAGASHPTVTSAAKSAADPKPDAKPEPKSVRTTPAEPRNDAKAEPKAPLNMLDRPSAAQGADKPWPAAKLEMPEQDIVHYRASANIPHGGALLLSASSRAVKTFAGEDVELAIVVRVRVIAPNQ